MRMQQAMWLAAAVEATARNVLRQLVRGVLRQSRHHNLMSPVHSVGCGLDKFIVVMMLSVRNKFPNSDPTKTYTFCQVCHRHNVTALNRTRVALLSASNAKICQQVWPPQFPSAVVGGGSNIVVITTVAGRRDVTRHDLVLMSTCIVMESTAKCRVTRRHERTHSAANETEQCSNAHQHTPTHRQWTEQESSGKRKAATPVQHSVALAPAVCTTHQVF
jgi:hypothetical protein